MMRKHYRSHSDRTALCGALLLLLLSSTQVWAQARQPISYRETGAFAASKLRESSGVAVSRSQPGVLWTHNDSGDKSRIFATNIAGEDLGTFDVRGAKSKDWEDIALGPCPGRDGSCLYIADTGDNSETRSKAVVYIVPEPAVRDDGKKGKTEKAHDLDIRYPDGSHDVEALAVSPDGTIYLVSKGRRGAIVVYAVPAALAGEKRVAAVPVDTLPIVPLPALGRWVTGAAISPSGRRFAVRTYVEVFFFDRAADGTLTFHGPSCWLGPRQLNGEAIDFLDEDTVVLTTEARRGRKGVVALARCPA